jgi:hypothetical protein
MGRGSRELRGRSAHSRAREGERINVTGVAALYIDPRGPYPKLLGVGMCWDEARDARTYDGPWPVIAHPPCGPWSSLRHLHTHPEQRDHFSVALAAVRRWGGVIEHPAYSSAFAAHGINPIMQVQQCDWGHPARKRTWLYFFPADLWAPPVPPPREPTHWCSGVHTPGARGETPPGIKVCSAQQRRRTPVAFAEWLIQVARSARQSVRKAF